MTSVTNTTVTNTDDDTAGITVEPTSGLTTTEAGETDTFTAVLDSEPLPLGHRETVQKYFESIRPSNEEAQASAAPEGE